MKEDKETEEYNKKIEKYFTTQGHKKLLAYFLDIIKSDYFLDKIKGLRELYKIPEEGFKHKDTYSTPPGEWFYAKDFEVIGKINNELDKICIKYELHYMDWRELMEHYLFYNELSELFYGNSYNLCILEDIVLEKKEAELEKKNGLYIGFFEKSNDLAFPVAIRISPYASQRDIVDFVKKIYPIIKDYQERYIKKGIKIGKVKTKNKKVQERNDFIYEQNKQGKSLKEIFKAVSNEFNEILDEGHISKVISLEKKRRKEM